MNELPESAQEVVDRFADVNLHDAKLLGVHVLESSSDADEEVRLDLLLVAGEGAREWQRATLRFLGCTAMRSEIDFWNKDACSDSIADATCKYDREWIKRAADDDPVRQRNQRLEYMLCFQVDLCPPSGSLTVYARDFTLEM